MQLRKARNLTNTSLIQLLFMLTEHFVNRFFGICIQFDQLSLFFASCCVSCIKAFLETVNTKIYYKIDIKALILSFIFYIPLHVSICRHLHQVMFKYISVITELSVNMSHITYSLITHEAEPYLRSCQLCSYSRTSQHFMEPEGSLPCS
jgi:hypothetical protein